MGEQAEQPKDRARPFALDVLKSIKGLPREEPGPTIRRQLAKAATSVSANYRATCRSRSPDEFISRIAVVAEEADECEHWLDIVTAAGLGAPGRWKELQREPRELRAIFAASYATAKRNRASKSPNRSITKSPNH